MPDCKLTTPLPVVCLSLLRPSLPPCSCTASRSPLGRPIPLPSRPATPPPCRQAAVATAAAAPYATALHDCLFGALAALVACPHRPAQLTRPHALPPPPLQTALQAVQQAESIAERAGLQARVFDTARSADDLAAVLICARHARHATPGANRCVGPAQHSSQKHYKVRCRLPHTALIPRPCPLHHCRAVLGLLPCMRLGLPEDPPTLLHRVSCLLEVVAVDLTAAEDDDEEEELEERKEEVGAEAEGDSEDKPPFHQQLPVTTVDGLPAVRLRITVFAAGEIFNPSLPTSSASAPGMLQLASDRSRRQHKQPYRRIHCGLLTPSCLPPPTSPHACSRSGGVLARGPGKPHHPPGVQFPHKGAHLEHPVGGSQAAA